MEMCGVENPDYPGEYHCTYPKGHDKIACNEDDIVEMTGVELYDHASPRAGAWWNFPSPLQKVINSSEWYPTIQNCDNYMEDRTGKYEFRKVRYDAAIRWMLDNGLVDGMTVVDVGAGMTELAYCMMHDWELNVRYIPIDGGIDGTDLEHWNPARDAHFFVALELLEHLRDWERLLWELCNAATIGVVVSTPNPETTDVIGMDPTHVREVSRRELEAFAFDVKDETFYGGVFSEGKPDSLFATWRK